MRIKLENVCKRGSSNLRQSDVEGKTGEYPIFGAAGYIGNVDFYHQKESYIGVVKDGAGVGRVVKLPAKSSVIGTMQYIIPNSDVDVSYLAYAMEHMNLAKYYSGATIPHIYFKDYCKETIPLHSAIEQRHIAAVLDKAAALIDLRKQQLAKLDELVKARFVEIFGDPVTNTQKWEIVKLDSLCNVGSSKRIYQNEQSKGGIPFLRISDLVTKMDTGETTSDLFIPEEKYNELVENGLVPKDGDILVTARGTLGRCYIIQESDRFYFQDGMITWLSELSESITALYISQLFDMGGIKKQIDELQAGSTVAYLSIAMTKKLDIMLPPIELQNQFAAFVKQIDKSKAAIQKSLDESQLLFDSLMQKYFG